VKQLIHIFKKDFRHLWSELLLFAAFLGLYVWTELHPDTAFITLPVLAKVMIPIGAAYVIVRLVHAEAIPGHNQFWLTRPYRWRSLLGAKLVFILLCVNLPMFAARATLLLLQDFPLSPGLLNLAWSQLEMTAVIFLPLAAIAALTAGLASFISALIVGILVPAGVLVLFQYPYFQRATFFGPVETDNWIPGFYASVMMVLVVGGLLYGQYKSRRNWLSRVVALVTLVTGSMICLHVPQAMSAGLNAWIAEPLPENTGIQLRLTPEMEMQPFKDGSFVSSRMPVSISGVPEGHLIYVPRFPVTFKGDGGRAQAWFSGWSSLYRPQPAVVNYQSKAFTTDPSFVSVQVANSRGRSLHAQASVDLYLFPPAITKKVRLGNTPANVGGGFQCYFNLLAGGGFRSTRCRSAVGWPFMMRVSMTRGEPAETKTYEDESQYPLVPSNNFTLSSVEERSVGWAEPVSPEFTVSILGPPRHFHREVDLDEVHVTLLPATERRQ